jgi:CO/xanthine dehydrogenase FAD-binding subunit
MITEYYRPKKLEEALKLLSALNTRPLGGGTVLSHPSVESFAVVDLQALGLDKLIISGGNLKIGATVTLQALVISPYAPEAMKTALKLEAPLNLRNMGTVAGTLVTCDGRSPFGVVMLAMDARISMCSFAIEDRETHLGELLTLREELLRGMLITAITVPVNIKLAYKSVARSPSDKPIICVALAQWPSGRTRMVIGGWGRSPSVAMDGNDLSGLQLAARNAALDATDEWASAEYRSAIAAVLAERCVENID